MKRHGGNVNTWRKCKYILLNERSQSQKAAYIVTTEKWQNYGGVVKILRVGGREEWVSGTHDFYGSETILCGTVTMDPRCYTFVKTHRTCHAKSEPWDSHGGPVAKDRAVNAGAQLLSVVRKLDPACHT